jgi:hypothetical protein
VVFWRPPFGDDLNETRMLKSVRVHLLLHPNTAFQLHDAATASLTRQRVSHHNARSFERLPLATSCPDVVARIVQIDLHLAARTAARPRRAPCRYRVELIIDATGVGLPVIDLLREQEFEPIAALFTGSEKLTPHGRRWISVGKGYMVSRPQMLLQSRRLHLPETSETIILTTELLDYEISVSDRGHASFNARQGAHDNLVIALGLSVRVE